MIRLLEQNFVHNLFPMYILLEHHNIFQKLRIIRISVQYILYLSAHIQLPSFSAEYARFVKLVILILCN